MAEQNVSQTERGADWWKAEGGLYGERRAGIGWWEEGGSAKVARTPIGGEECRAVRKRSGLEEGRRAGIDEVGRAEIGRTACRSKAVLR